MLEMFVVSVVSTVYLATAAVATYRERKARVKQTKRVVRGR